MSSPPAVGIASRRGSRDHNCDAARVYRSLDATVAAAVIDGTGNSPVLAEMAGVMATVAVRIGIRHGGLPGLMTAGDLLVDDDHDGAAVLAVVPPDGHAVVSWVGDCRAYHWAGGELRQYTTDHTMGQQLRASGGIPVEVARSHDHWLLVGLRGATAATVRQVWIPDYDQDLVAGDRVLLTSDGVHDAIRHDDLVRLVEAHQDPQALAEAIVNAVEADGDGYRDDATVVVLTIGAE